MKLKLVTTVIIVLMLTSSFSFMALDTVYGEEIEEKIIDPYEEVEWGESKHLKSAFHTHVHDRGYSEAEVIDAHNNIGFDVLAITDNDRVSYPWEDLDPSRDPEELDMVAIEGSEHQYVEGGEHMINLFTDIIHSWTEGRQSMLDGIEDTGNAGGLMFHAHPNDPNRYKLTSEQFANDVSTYDHVLGLEIGNRQYSTTRRGELQYWRTWEIFDDLMTEYGLNNEEDLPFLFSVTDVYPDYREDEHEDHLKWLYDLGYVELLTEDKSQQGVRNALENGHFLWVDNHDTDGVTDPTLITEPPIVEEVEVTETEIKLDITGDYNEVRWRNNNETIQEGETFSLGESDLKEGDYVIFEIWDSSNDPISFNSSNIVGSQAFLIRDSYDSLPLFWGDEGADLLREYAVMVVVGIGLLTYITYKKFGGPNQ